MEPSSIVSLLLSFGFVGVGCLAIAEKFVPLFPSYVLLMLLGLTVPDIPTLVLTIVATTLGSVVGGLGWYAIGWWLGPQKARSAIAHYGKYVLLRPALYDRLTNAYQRNHFWVTLSGQIIPAIRIYLALPAGILKLQLRIFLTATLLGCFMWNGPFLCLGYALRGSGSDPVQVGFWAAIVLIAAEGTILLTVRVRKGARRG
ncbi:DedA family protein [Mesorhizobium sp. INR15]|uniref:DedA family protein n=1 Tax=Mesorhizobium sp. INR15 TaxID=2654248 RepID=UPI00189675BB|nr:DedA family protein [Mesorhizobium sp. INR15]QPC91332.1 DedA family protein [Mesorhizobium sp. INR15]